MCGCFGEGRQAKDWVCQHFRFAWILPRLRILRCGLFHLTQGPVPAGVLLADQRPAQPAACDTREHPYGQPYARVCVRAAQGMGAHSLHLAPLFDGVLRALPPGVEACSKALLGCRNVAASSGTLEGRGPAEARCGSLSRGAERTNSPGRGWQKAAVSRPLMQLSASTGSRRSDSTVPGVFEGPLLHGRGSVPP